MDSIPIYQSGFDIGSSSAENLFSAKTTSWILFGLIIAVILLFIIFLIIVIKPKSNNITYGVPYAQNGEFDYLTVNNQSNLNGAVIIGPAPIEMSLNERQVKTANQFDIHYESFFTENITMTKNAIIEGSMTVSDDSFFNNNLSVVGDLGVTGTATFNRDILAKEGIIFSNLDNTYIGNVGSIFNQENQINIQGGTGGISLLNSIGNSIIDFEENNINVFTSISALDITIPTGTMTSEFITLGQSGQKYKMSANIGSSTDFTITSIPNIGPTGAILMDFSKDGKTAYLLDGYTGGVEYGLYVGPTGARGQVYDTVYNPFPSNLTLTSLSVSATGTFGNLIISDDSYKIQLFGMNQNVSYPIQPTFSGDSWYGKIYNYKSSTYYDYPVSEWNLVITGVKSNSTTDNKGTYFYVYPDVSGYWYFRIQHIDGGNMDSDLVDLPSVNFLAIPSGLSYGNTGTMIQS